MGATQVVAWIDWLRGTGDRPADDSVISFFTIELAGRRFLVASEYFFPYFRPRFLLDELEFAAAHCIGRNLSAGAMEPEAVSRTYLRWMNWQLSLSFSLCRP